MIKNRWLRYTLTGFFYLSLALLGYSFYTELETITYLHRDDQLNAEFEGSDWVTWEEREDGIFAKDVHPLLSYKSTIKVNDIRQGDRLRSIDHNLVAKVEVVDQISSSTSPGKYLAFIVERPNSIQTMEEVRSVVINGFRLAFTFNDNGTYWSIAAWGVGIGAFLSLIIFAILIPLLRGNWRSHIALIGVVIGAILFFVLQLGRNLYLIVEEDFTKLDTELGVEKIFVCVYVVLLFFYIINYFHFKAEGKNILFALPSIILAAFLLYHFYDIIYVRRQLKYFHGTIEDYTFLFFFFHLIAAIVLHAIRTWKERRRRETIASALVALITTLGITYFGFDLGAGAVGREEFLGAYSVLLFFPLGNATFFQLQFGKVRVVITRTIQYIFFFVVTSAIFLLITQLSEFVLGDNSFKQELEFLTLLIFILLIRWVYISNESKFSRYFTTAQREKDRNIKSFIAQIPRYTSAKALRKDLVDELMDYFHAETVHLWWKGEKDENPENIIELHSHAEQESIYRQLKDNHTVWSKNKEIAPFRLDEDLENLVLKSAYTLVSPITVDQENYALLMLGRKRRGVYNLSDLEAISQLVQQTQLTLNIIQLNTREKQLIQQKYEADLMALRSQINPHFLFNTLNSLTELVHESPDRAEDAIEKLSFIFRYTTKESKKNLVPLESEIRLVSTYLDLEKIRFGDRLDVRINVEPDVRDVEIPAFVLQTLIENCIKHGIAKILHKGKVSIDAFEENGFLVCEVRDNGPGIDMSRIFKSTGLSNTISRFENIYETKNLLYFENTGEGTLVRFRVPLMEIPKLNAE